jgi:hypothetical protein
MDLNMDPAVSLSQAGTVSATALQYLRDLQVKSELRKISETRTVSVEDVVELTAAAQATLSSGDTAA